MYLYANLASYYRRDQENARYCFMGNIRRSRYILFVKTRNTIENVAFSYFIDES